MADFLFPLWLTLPGIECITSTLLPLSSSMDAARHRVLPPLYYLSLALRERTLYILALATLTSSSATCGYRDVR